MGKNSISFGIDNLLANYTAETFGKIGLVTNDAAYTAHGEKSREILLQHGFEIINLFSPEHGLSAKGADGAFIPNGTDLLTNLPIISLYGNILAPSEQDLADLDTVFFDIPDVGLRYYTYLWTLTHLLEQCAKYHKKLLILDRPNPLGEAIEGPILDETHCSSFIGRWEMPLRHGATLGELALFFNKERQIGAALEVIPCINYHKSMVFTDWQLAFQPTSPAIVSWESMLAYPITAYFEATNLSDGRGTNAPFAQIGATWLQDFDFSALQKLSKDVFFEPCEFVPAETKFQNKKCFGLHIKVLNPKEYKPVFIGLCLLKAIKDQFPQYFRWNPYPTRANPSGARHLDFLIGIAHAEHLFDLSWHEFIAKISQITQTKNWMTSFTNFQIYS